MKLHLLTPATYESPQACVTARLLVRILRDLLMPAAYHAGVRCALNHERVCVCVRVGETAFWHAQPTCSHVNAVLLEPINPATCL